MMDATEAITLDDSQEPEAPIVFLLFDEAEAIDRQKALPPETYRTRKYRRYISAGGITLTVWVLVVRVKDGNARQLKLL